MAQATLPAPHDSHDDGHGSARSARDGDGHDATPSWRCGCSCRRSACSSGPSSRRTCSTGVAASKGPTPKDVYNIPFTSVTSFILLMSSLTMVLALAAIQRGDHRRFRVWIIATGLFGVTFIGGQIYEFTEFYREGLSLSTNVFGSSFFVLTGIHGAHVTVGIIWLLSLWGLSMQGKLGVQHSERVEIAGLYWHFVDVVWIVIFTVIYLIPPQ